MDVQAVSEETQTEIDIAEAPVKQEPQQLSEQVRHLTALLEAQTSQGPGPPLSK